MWPKVDSLSKSLLEDGQKMKMNTWLFKWSRDNGRLNLLSNPFLTAPACPHPILRMCAEAPINLHVTIPLYQRQLKGVATVEP